MPARKRKSCNTGRKWDESSYQPTMVEDVLVSPSDRKPDKTPLGMTGCVIYAKNKQRDQPYLPGGTRGNWGGCRPRGIKRAMH